MAEQRRSGRKGVPHHPLVEALASDPDQPPEKATKLFGYPGPASAAKSTRLWLDADLTSYVEVPDEAIVHSQTLENDQGTILWVEPSATLTHSTTQSQEVQAEFLGGAIASGNLPGAGPSVEWGSPWGGYTGETRAFPCGPVNSLDPWTCESRFFICPPETVQFPCPPDTFRPPCPPDTFRPPCPPESFRFPCQSQQIPCPPESFRIPCPPESRLVICRKSFSFPCITREPRICDPDLVASAVPPCDRPWEKGWSPVVNPVGPFRPAGGQ